MTSLAIPTSGLADFIVALAAQHGVAYVETPHDKLANVITHLSDDDVEFDEIEWLIIALERAGYIKREEVLPLHYGYLKEKLHRV